MENKFYLDLPQAVPSSAGAAAQNEHIDDDVEANRGAMIACIMGAVILVILIAVCCIMMMKRKKMMEMGRAQGGNTAGNRTQQVSQSSFSANPSQGKLDDIM